MNKLVEKMIEARNKQSKNYESWYKSNRTEKGYQEEIDSIMKAVDPKSSNLILDAGIGTGQFGKLIAPKCKYLIGLDYSEESVKIFNEKNIKNATAYVHDITNPILLVKFDKVFSSQVIQHIPTDALRFETLRNIYNILNRNGAFICELFDYDSSKWKIRRLKSFSPFRKEEVYEDYYCYYYKMQEFIELLKKVGFRENRVIYKKNGFFITKSVK